MTGFVNDFDLFWDTSKDLLDCIDISVKKIRLMGLSVSNIYQIEQPKVYQLRFDFDQNEQHS